MGADYRTSHLPGQPPFTRNLASRAFGAGFYQPLNLLSPQLPASTAANHQPAQACPQPARNRRPNCQPDLFLAQPPPFRRLLP